jgi:hypothetical protein
METDIKVVGSQSNRDTKMGFFQFRWRQKNRRKLCVKIGLNFSNFFVFIIKSEIILLVVEREDLKRKSEKKLTMIIIFEMDTILLLCKIL